MGCLMLLFAQPARSQQPALTLPSASERVHALSTLWMEATYNFAYFDNVPYLNWDSAYVAYIPKVQAVSTYYDYYKVLASFLNLLKDGHTNLNFPRALADVYSKPGIRLTCFENKPYITDVDRTLLDSVPIGAAITHVNGEPTIGYLEREVLPITESSVEAWRIRAAIEWHMLRFPKNTRVKLTIQLPKSGTRMVNLLNNSDNVKWVSGDKKEPLTVFNMLPNSIAYFAINTYGDPSVVDSLDKYMLMIRKAKGLVLDIRKNGGGNSDNGAEVLFRLTEQKKIIGSRWITRMHIASYRAWGMYAKENKDTSAEGRRVIPHYERTAWYNPKELGGTDADNLMISENNYTAERYQGPIVVLQSWKTGSAGEDFLIMLNQLDKKRATTLGEPTNGSTGQPLSILLSGNIWSRICTKRDTWANGRKFVGVGIAPDITVSVSAADYFAGKDSVLEKALSVIANQR